LSVLPSLMVARLGLIPFSLRQIKAYLHNDEDLQCDNLGIS
jgi:hypothetical protein